MTVVTTMLGGHATLCATLLSNPLFDCTRLSSLIPNQLAYLTFRGACNVIYSYNKTKDMH